MGKIKEEHFVLSILNKKLYGEKTSNWFEPKQCLNQVSDTASSLKLLPLKLIQWIKFMKRF